MAAQTIEIILVEDHDLVREELVLFLQRPGWSVRGVDCGEMLDTALRSKPADIAILDLNLPFEDGYSIAKRLRRAKPSMGVVMLTARTRPGDRTAGYEIGADVFLTKPTNMAELEAVVHNLVRRISPAEASAPVLHMGRLALNLPNGTHISLTLNEAQLLRELATAPERQLDAAQLIRRMSGEFNGYAPGTYLKVMISRLRNKFDGTPLSRDVVKAKRGHGYALTVPISLEE